MTITLATDNTLEQGDAARLRSAGPLTVTGSDDEAEILVWEMHAELGRD